MRLGYGWGKVTVFVSTICCPIKPSDYVYAHSALSFTFLPWLRGWHAAAGRREGRLKILWKSDSWPTPYCCLVGLRGIYKDPSNINLLVVLWGRQSKPEPQPSLSNTVIHTDALLHPNVFWMRERLNLHSGAETWAQPAKHKDLGVSVYHNIQILGRNPCLHNNLIISLQGSVRFPFFSMIFSVFRIWNISTMGARHHTYLKLP